MPSSPGGISSLGFIEVLTSEVVFLSSQWGQRSDKPKLQFQPGIFFPRSDKKKRRKLVLVIIAAEITGISVQAIIKSNIKPKGLRAVLYGGLRAARGQKNDFTVTGMRGINHIVYESGETLLYTDKSDTQLERPLSPTSESNQAQPLLILLFITTRLRMWQLSCRGLATVHYKACRTSTPAASFRKRKTHFKTLSEQQDAVEFEPMIFTSVVPPDWSQIYLI